MWKPGSKKPGSGSKKKKGGKSPAGRSSTSSSSVSGLQIPESTDSTPLKKNNNNGPLNAENTNSSSNSRKKLSGSTMNMRFMQRHSQSQSRSPPRSRSREPSQQTSKTPISTSTTKIANSPHQDTQSPAQSMSISPQHEVVATTTPVNDQEMADSNMSDESESDVEMKESAPSSRYGVATSIDMYGYNHVAVIGRRSFGGFNPTMAEAWQLSQQAERDMSQEQQAISDKELVKRYMASRKSADRQKAVGPRSKGTKKRQKTSLS